MNLKDIIDIYNHSKCLNILSNSLVVVNRWLDSSSVRIFSYFLFCFFTRGSIFQFLGGASHFQQSCLFVGYLKEFNSYYSLLFFKMISSMHLYLILVLKYWDILWVRRDFQKICLMLSGCYYLKELMVLRICLFVGGWQSLCLTSVFIYQLYWLEVRREGMDLLQP